MTTATTDQPLSKRAVSIVDARTRIGDPFAIRTAVTTTLSRTRSRDPNTSPSDAVRLAIANDELVALPSPTAGWPALTVRDKRRLAACASRYRDAGERGNAQACVDRIESLDVPAVLSREYVIGVRDYE